MFAPTHAPLVPNRRGLRRLWLGLVFPLLALALECRLLAQRVFYERHANPSAGALRAIAANDTLIVTVGDEGRVLTSPDGAAWTRGNTGVSDTLRGVTAGGGTFVAVGDRGRIVASSDASQWQTISSASSAQLNAVAYGNARFVAVGESGTILTTTDASSWTQANSGVTSSLRAVSWVPSPVRPYFLACGAGGVIVISFDGVSWTRQNSGTDADLAAMGPSGLPILAADGSLLFTGFTTSATGSTWTVTRTAGLAGSWRSVAAQIDGAIYSLAVGDDGVVMAGAGFQRRLQSGTTRTLHAASFIRGTFMATGEAETILQGTPSRPARMQLENLSTRGPVTAGDGTLISGFVIEGTGTKHLLLRAAGPSLVQFGVGSPVLQPTLVVYDARGAVVASNTGWSTSPDADLIRWAASTAAAYPFSNNSADSALAINLPPGAYTAHLTGPPGIGLIELYDADTWPVLRTSRLANMSSRCIVNAGEAVAIAGLSVPANRTLLVRAIGPTLASEFGVRGALENPKLEIIRPEIASPVRGTTPLPALTITSNDDWNTQLPPSLGANPDGTLRPIVGVSWRGTADEIRAAAAECGAFPLAEESKDAAVLVRFDYSPMTLRVSGADGGSGIALIEIYDLGER